MDELNRYRQIVREVLSGYADWTKGDGVTTQIIENNDHNLFVLFRYGWDGTKRIHGAILHVDIIGDKVWIQHDGTNIPLAEELVNAGIPKDRIVLGFHSERKRPLTGYAVG